MLFKNSPEGRNHMFRIWGKLVKDNRLLQDAVIINENTETRTAKVLSALDALCLQFDLGIPIWLDVNIRDFQKHAKTRFTQDSFMEPIGFDFLEFEVIEED